MISRHKQQGAETVEFALIAALFFLLLFAAFEFSRALFYWNALTEATRRGARMAIICPFNDPTIPQQVAVFQAIGNTGNSPIINGLEPSDVQVRYLQADGLTDATTAMETKFIQVSITGYQHHMIIPFMNQLFTDLTAPQFITTLPAESLGARPTYPGEALSTPACTF